MSPTLEQLSYKGKPNRAKRKNKQSNNNSGGL